MNPPTINPQSKILAGLMGVCVGDALGLPVQFTTRRDRLDQPVTTMQGYGTYNKPPGTWSDDSSLTFCLAEALSQELLTDALYPTLADYFCRWYKEGYWTPNGVAFDIGNTTSRAMSNLEQGVTPTQAGETAERSNGNGSLMRILPLVFCHPLVESEQFLKIVHDISAVTHAHLRSQMACGIYVNIAIGLLAGKKPLDAYQWGIEQVRYIYQKDPYQPEFKHFKRVMNGDIQKEPIHAIASSGYVVDSLEAALWCFLNSHSYMESVLKAVNLGDDTDTIAAITGGLSGIYYGFENIPTEWVEMIAKKEEIMDLANRLEKAINSSLNA